MLNERSERGFEDSMERYLTVELPYFEAGDLAFFLGFRVFGKVENDPSDAEFFSKLTQRFAQRVRSTQRGEPVRVEVNLTEIEAIDKDLSELPSGNELTLAAMRAFPKLRSAFEEVSHTQT